MGLTWQAYGLGHLAKSIHGYYVVYRNFDNEMKTNRWFANMRLDPTGLESACMAGNGIALIQLKMGATQT